MRLKLCHRVHQCDWLSERCRRHIVFALGLAIILASCRPATPTPFAPRALPPPSAVHEANPDSLDLQETAPAASATPVESPRIIAWSARGVSFEGVAFDARMHRLRVVDQSGGPGSQFTSAAMAASSVGGIAAVNAGFFTHGGEPLGLVMSEGNPAGQWNGGTSLGAGVWHEMASGGARIIRREALGAAAARQMSELLQSGPMLVEGGLPVKGLHGGEPRPRTLIAWDGGHRWWIGSAAPCSMPELAAALASGSGVGFPVRSALNLDGGRSSELWVGDGVAGGPLTRRPMWNRAVRNHLVLVRR